jgi:hypothetical protein
MTQQRKSFDKPSPVMFISRVTMNTTFTKQLKKHTPVTGCMAIWQRASRRFGVVGVKF